MQLLPGATHLKSRDTLHDALGRILWHGRNVHANQRADSHAAEVSSGPYSLSRRLRPAQSGKPLWVDDDYDGPKRIFGIGATIAWTAARAPHLRCMRCDAIAVQLVDSIVSRVRIRMQCAAQSSMQSVEQRTKRVIASESGGIFAVHRLGLCWDAAQYLLCARLKFSKANTREYSGGSSSLGSQPLVRQLLSPRYRANRFDAAIPDGVSICTAGTAASARSHCKREHRLH